jgi:hypothetical protein
MAQVSDHYRRPPWMNDPYGYIPIKKPDIKSINSGIGIYTINYVSEVIVDKQAIPELDGHFDSDTKIIQICDKGDRKEQVRILLHELNHLVLYMAGYGNTIVEESEEHIVSGFTNMWLILETLNPGLLEYIGKNLNA